MERVYSAKSYPHLPVKVIKAEWRRLTDGSLAEVETRGSTQPNVVAQAFFSRSLICHVAFNTLIRSFLVLPALTSRFRALVLGQMVYGPPRWASSCASASPC